MKQFETLYIDGQLVNIGTSDIVLEWKSVMLSNISRLKASHSYTIKLPMTANNRKVFESAEDAAHNSYMFASGRNTRIGRRMSARYFCNGIDLIGDANAYLIGTESNYYKVVLTWGSLSVMQDIIDEARTLPEVFGGPEDNPTTILWERWANWKISDELGENVVCLAYDSGIIGDEMMGYTYYLPSFKVTWLMDKIFRKYGVAYDLSRRYVDSVTGEESVLTEKLLDSLYIPMTTWRDSEYVQNQCRNTWHLTRTQGGEEHTLLYGDYAASMSRVYWQIPSGGTSPVYGWIGVFQKMKYRVHVHVRVFVDRQESGMTESEMVSNIKLAIVNGNTKESASKLLSLTATSIVKLPLSLIDLGVGLYVVTYEYVDEWVEIGVNDTPADDSWKGTHEGQDTWDDIIEIRQGRRVWIDGWEKAYLGNEQEFLSKVSELRGYGYTIDIPEYDNYIEIIPEITTPMPWHEQYNGLYQNGEEKSPLYLEPNFPDIKPIDFLKGVFYLIGAYPVIVNNTLKLTLYRDLVDNVHKAADWTSFVVEEGLPLQIEFELTDWGQRNWLRYKDDNEDNPLFSDFFYIDDDYLQDSTDIFTLPFEGSKTRNSMALVPIYEPGKVLNYLKNPSSNWTFADEIDGYVLKECQPRIGVRISLGKTLSEILGTDVFWLQTSSDSGQTTQFTDLPLVSMLRDSLIFSPINFKEKNSEVWQRYVVFSEMLRHPYVVTLSMDVDDFTLGSLDMSIPVFLRQFNSYFGIISIKRKSDGLSTVKLLKIPNKLICNRVNNERSRNQDT